MNRTAHRFVVELFGRCFGHGSAAKKQINRVHNSRVERHEPSLAFCIDKQTDIAVAGAFTSNGIDEKFGQTVKVARSQCLVCNEDNHSTSVTRLTHKTAVPDRIRFRTALASEKRLSNIKPVWFATFGSGERK